MNSHLRVRNEHLLRDMRRLSTAIQAADVPDELLPYKEVISEFCMQLERRVNRNLQDLSLGATDILEDILSNTRWVNYRFKVISSHLATPILRARPSDRLSLKIISWLHNEHSSTATYPAAVANNDVSMLPLVDVCPIYFFPAVEQETLLYQPLYFHEFGHLLYRCHKPELDALVSDLQKDIRTILTPSSYRSDIYSSRQRDQREAIVGTWYNWAQELFCDAVGLLIGGPAFLLAFSMYMGNHSRSDFELPPEKLRDSSHPVTWLRIQLLLSRARSMGLIAGADATEEEWKNTAGILGVTEDYHGFFDESLNSAIDRFLEDAEVEVAPREFLGSEVDDSVAIPVASDNPVTLLNRAWTVFSSDGTNYQDWESEAIESWLSDE